MLIPDGDYILKAGDKLHLATSHRNMELFFKKIAGKREKIKNVMICGGGRVAYYLANQLSDLGMHIKIIEKNRENDVKNFVNCCQKQPSSMEMLQSMIF